MPKAREPGTVRRCAFAGCVETFEVPEGRDKRFCTQRHQRAAASWARTPAPVADPSDSGIERAVHLLRRKGPVWPLAVERGARDPNWVVHGREMSVEAMLAAAARLEADA